MLILTRRIGETLVIDSKIRVTVLSVKGLHVRVGVAAPKTVAVDREEVFNRKRQKRYSEKQERL